MRTLLTGLLPLLLLLSACVAIHDGVDMSIETNDAKEPPPDREVTSDVGSDAADDSITLFSDGFDFAPEDVWETPVTHPENQDNVLAKPPVTFAPFSPGAGTSQGDNAKLVSTFGTLGGGRATVGRTRLHTFSNPLVLIF